MILFENVKKYELFHPNVGDGNDRYRFCCLIQAGWRTIIVDSMNVIYTLLYFLCTCCIPLSIWAHWNAKLLFRCMTTCRASERGRVSKRTPSTHSLVSFRFVYPSRSLDFLTHSDFDKIPKSVQKLAQSFVSLPIDEYVKVGSRPSCPKSKSARAFRVVFVLYVYRFQLSFALKAFPHDSEGVFLYGAMCVFRYNLSTTESGRRRWKTDSRCSRFSTRRCRWRRSRRRALRRRPTSTRCWLKRSPESTRSKLSPVPRDVCLLYRMSVTEILI